MSAARHLLEPHHLPSPSHAGRTGPVPPFRTLLDWIYPPAPRRAPRLATRTVFADQVKSRTWGQLSDDVVRAAAGLLAAGLRLGDRVGLVAEAGYLWTVADLAIMLAGGVSVPWHRDSTPREYEQICSDASVSLVFAGGRLERDRLRAIAPALPTATPVVAFDAWDAFLATGDGHRSAVHARWLQLHPERLATIIYTSGASGEPKGAAFDHRAVLAGPTAFSRAGLLARDDVQLFFLPTSHVFGRALQSAWLVNGHVLVFCPPERAVEALRTVRPTLLAASPRFYERCLVEAGESVSDRLQSDQSGASRRPLAGYRFRRSLGGRLRAAFCGMTALSPALWRAYRELGVELLEGYGLTESGATGCVSRPGRSRPGIVGRALRGTSARVGPGGEVLLKGPGLMRGYWARPAESAEVLRDGWLRTGDLGEVDVDGCLRITGRRDDRFTMDTGRHIYPNAIEARLRALAPLAYALVHGAGRCRLTALVTVDERVVRAAAVALGLENRPYAEVVREPGVREQVSTAIRSYNEVVSPPDRIWRHAIVPQPFSAGGGELTPTGKLRRSAVEVRYAKILDDLYDPQPGFDLDPSMKER